ncbi:serine protease [Yinghuangia seranimata]|uniref:serine protease n=1 Tax=Yinghuangia seranimata TaxID=408067 RepID=UPI00248BB13C|nr:serine protease [Yinghuangia seranimata]MDI2130641.1 serine protease [Yinghuangia seranimata]
MDMDQHLIRRRGLIGVVALALVAGASLTGFTSVADPATVALTITHIGRDGAAADAYATTVTGVSGPGADVSVRPYDASGTVTVRLPRGRYLLDSRLTGGTDWIVRPRLDLDRDTAVTVDARTTRPVDVRPPDPAARFSHSAMFVEVTHAGATRTTNLLNGSPNLRVAHLGPDAEPGLVRQWFDAYWVGPGGPGPAAYALGYTFTGERALTGLVRHPAPRDLAAVVVRGGAGPGTTGTASVELQPTAGPTAGLSQTLPVPGSATYMVTPERGTWDITYFTSAAPGTRSSRYGAYGIAVAAGATSTHTFDTPVFAPALPAGAGVTRDGDTLTVDIPVLADGAGHAPAGPRYDRATTTLHRDGVLVGKSNGDPGRAQFTTTPGRGVYRLTTHVARQTAPGFQGSITASWTFRSATTGGPTPLPVSVVRFAPELSLSGTAEPWATRRVPVVLQGAAAQGRVRSLSVTVSTDGGRTWSRLPVVDGAVTIRNPAAGHAVSLRADLIDGQGNTLTETLLNAYVC